MPITREKKQELVKEIAQAFAGSKSVVFANFHGVNVSDEQAMRRALHKEGVGYMVARKTLVKRALSEAKVEGTMPDFAGELAVVYGDDLTAPAREFYVFQKKYEGRVKILGGIFDGKYMNVAEMTGIAAIPSQQTLYAQFVNLINSPIQRFAVVLNQIAGTKTA